MKLKVLDTDNWVKDLPEIDSHKIYESGKFAKGGLFSQQIFGPVKSYSCALRKPTCNASRMRAGEVCKVCGVEISSSEVRRKRFARVKLPFKILNPLFYYMISNSKMSAKRIIMDMLSYRYKYYIENDKKLVRVSKAKEAKDKEKELEAENTDESEEAKVEEVVKEIEDNKPELLDGLEGVKTYIKWLIEKNKGKPIFDFINDHFDKVEVDNIVVIPPDFRPLTKTDKKSQVADEINALYSQIIIRSNNMKNLPFTVSTDDEIFHANFWNVQISTIKLYDFVLKKLSKKTGLIRSNILGKRIDFSGRAVISPEPEISLSECVLPYYMILEIFKPQLVAYMINRKLCRRYNQACSIIEECIKNRDPSLFKLVSEFCVGKLCVLNRQPTLHRLGILGFNIKVHLGNTIKLHPLVCHPYNADFDGDAMAVYIPITKKSFKDVRDKIHIKHNLVSPTDISTVPAPNQDIILGIFAATKEDGEERELKGVKLSEGRYLFNKCLPEDFPIINKALNKKDLKSIFNKISLSYPPNEVIKSFDKIKTLGFNLSTLEGYTLSLDDLYREDLEDIATSFEGDFDKDMAKMRSKEVSDKLESLSVSDFINSGARGSWDQVKQLVLSRGYVADASNKIRKDNVIKSSLVTGLNPKEFFNSSWGSRKGLLDTALSTGETGYLTRQMIYSTVFMELGEVDDCGTEETICIDLDVIKNGKSDRGASFNLARTLLWRYYINGSGEKVLITRKELDNIVGQKINIRSPITCNSKKICKTCYGNLHKILHSQQIGIIATQSICERATQLVLRTFHISGVASSSADGQDNEDIISGITLANKLFHKPEDLGDINKPEDMVMMIYKIFGQYGSMHLVHYEVVASAMMWTRKGLWRLQKDRRSMMYKWLSILKIPSESSWLLGAAFSNVKSKIIDGVIKDRVDVGTSLTSLFRL